MARDQAEIVFTLVTEILQKVLEFNGDECIQYINQDELYFRVDAMFSNDLNSVDPANIVEILTSELIIFTLSQKEGSIVISELTDEARILNSVDYASLIPQEHISSFGAGRHAAHSTLGSSYVQKVERENNEMSDSNKELSSCNIISHATSLNVLGDDSSSSSNTCAAYVRTGAIPKRRIERKKYSLNEDYVAPHDKNVKRSTYGNNNELDQNFLKESIHITANISERHSPGVSPSRKVPLSEAAGIKSKIQATDIGENPVIGGMSSRVSHVENGESSHNGHNKDSSDSEDGSRKSCVGMTSREEMTKEGFSINKKKDSSDSEDGREKSCVGMTSREETTEKNFSINKYKDSCDSEDGREKLCVGMTSREETTKEDLAINTISNLYENSCNQYIECVSGSQSDPCNPESNSCLNIARDISEAVKDASSGLYVKGADLLLSDHVKQDSDEDTVSIKILDADLYSCHSESDLESEYEMCYDTTDPKTDSSCYSESGRVVASVHSPPPSANKIFESFENEISVFSLLPRANASDENESSKLQDCEGENDDTCEEFSMLSGASSVVCDNLLNESSPDDVGIISQSAVKYEESNVLQFSFENSSNELISIQQACGEDGAESSALGENSHDSPVIAPDSPIFMDGSPSGQNLLEHFLGDPPERDDSLASLFTHATEDETFTEMPQTFSVPIGKIKHSVHTRSSVRKPVSEHALLTISSTQLTEGSISPIDLDDEQASSSRNVSSVSEPILEKNSWKKDVTAQPSSSRIVMQHPNKNSVKAKLPSPPQSPVASGVTPISTKAAGQSSPNIIRLSAFCNAGRGYKLQNENYDAVVEISENNMAGVKSFAGTSTFDGKTYNFDAAQKKKSIKKPEEDWMTTHCKTLNEFFPDVDENYLFDRCQELTGSERRFEALVNELVLIENKPAKVLGAGGQQYRSPKSHFMSLARNSPNPRRPARPSEDDLDLEATIMDGMPLFDWLQKEEYGAAQAAPRPEEEAIECGCCCNSYSVEEMRHCEGDEVHLFCHNCIRSYCENQIGQSKYEMHCLSVSNCSALFSPSTLFNVLPNSVFKNLMANQQAEEISAANIDDLETCPFCPFSIIFDSKVTVSSPNIVFRCDNPDCGKPSCRLCKKAAHSPAKCEEVRAQTDARTHLENEMTEAMVRECVQCRKRFIKHDGCNKMTCSCGAKMCYICKQPVTSYDHFDNNTPAISNKCPLYTPDLPGLHAKEVQDRADALKRSMDPNLLLYDPTSS